MSKQFRVCIHNKEEGIQSILSQILYELDDFIEDKHIHGTSCKEVNINISNKYDKETNPYLMVLTVNITNS